MTDRVILEVSLKPFYDISDAGVREVCVEILRQWQPLLHGANQVSFLLWTAEGSEILDYTGNLEAEIDWAKWIGIANRPKAEWVDRLVCLHSRRWPYRENPPVVTYERLQFIVRALKETVAASLPHLSVTVGTVFDPGPEFAESSFKYKRHPEISVGDIMGDSQWVHCAATLHADNTAYIGFPDGITEGTTLGTFLGRQSQHFLTDVGFDYIWFSNGFGYSLSSWNVTGEVFDGKKFDRSRVIKVKDSILRFWRDFRNECPHFPIETRGSNLSTGMDLSSDASPVQQIYNGDFNLTAPVNSPWAALNGDYGLELVGWLSHIAELPKGSGIPFRYYIHDPWWLNSPWLDRYGRQPHDIYLPLALGRMNAEGGIDKPSSVSLLTIDDSYGQMPEEVALEVTPHIVKALKDSPDEAGLTTWIYPFDEYHEWTFGDTNRVDEVFFGDWFMRAAVNQGFPLNTVISTQNFLSAYASNERHFAATILVCLVPDEGTALADALWQHLENGGRVLMYGPIKHADKRFLDVLNVQPTTELAGTLRIRTGFTPDSIKSSDFPNTMEMRPLLSGGGAEAVIGSSISEKTQILAEVEEGTEKRVFAAFGEVSGGQLGWVRGALCETVTKQESLPIPDDPTQKFRAERLMRWMLQKFDCLIRFDKPSLDTPDPLILASRCRNGWFFSGYAPSTNCSLQWRLPYGVPVPVGCDVWLQGDTGTMALSRAWHNECRVFVVQKAAGEVSCHEQFSGEIGITRRLRLKGLKNAQVRFFADSSFSQSPPRFQKNDAYLGLGTPVAFQEESAGLYLTEEVSGEMLISW